MSESQKHSKTRESAIHEPDGGPRKSLATLMVIAGMATGLLVQDTHERVQLTEDQAAAAMLAPYAKCDVEKIDIKPIDPRLSKRGEERERLTVTFRLAETDAAIAAREAYVKTDKMKASSYLVATVGTLATPNSHLHTGSPVEPGIPQRVSDKGSEITHSWFPQRDYAPDSTLNFNLKSGYFVEHLEGDKWGSNEQSCFVLKRTPEQTWEPIEVLGHPADDLIQKHD